MTEQEKQELLKAALVLVDSMEVGERVSAEQLREAVETVKKHRPRPKLVEGWVNAGYNGTILSGIYTAKEYAVKNACTTSTRKGVHVREVTEPPLWDRWYNQPEGYITSPNANYISHKFLTSSIAAEICRAHNVEMERFEKAWKGEE
jgi:hypothetical protein